MHYADTSFVLSMLVMDSMTVAVRAVLRKRGRVPLMYSALHQMEVPNALRALHFQEASQMPAARRSKVEEGLKAAELRLLAMRKNGVLVDRDCDWDAVIHRFEQLSEAHTFKTGSRTLDTLHVAFAVELNCDEFITCDQRQAVLAKAAGLRVLLAGK